MNNLFVYGTLRKGKSRNYLLEGLNFKQAILNNFHKVKNEILNFPIIVKDMNSRVYGEIYFDIDEGLMKQLDEIEGEGHLYHRILVDIEIIEGDKIKAFTYYPHEDLIKNFKIRLDL